MGGVSRKGVRHPASHRWPSSDTPAWPRSSPPPSGPQSSPEVQQLFGYGLSHFQYDPLRQGVWSDWRLFPNLTIAADQGSDGISAWHYWLSTGVACTAFWDYSHGAQNDWKGVVKEMGLWEMWILCMVTWNAGSGPLSDATRHHALSEAWSDCFEQWTPKTNALFQALVPRIVDDRGGVSAFGHHDDIDVQVWELIRQSPPQNGPLEKCNLNRFFSTPRRARRELERWHETLLNFTYLALAENWLATRKFDALRLRKQHLSNDVAAPTSTAATELCAQPRRTLWWLALRSCQSRTTTSSSG